MTVIDPGKFRRKWRWLKAGFIQIMPYPNGRITQADAQMINNILYIAVHSCPETDFSKLLSNDIDDVFLNVTEFAVTGLFIDVDDNRYSLEGIFDDPYVESIPDTILGVQSVGPTFKCKLKDIMDKSTNRGVRKGDHIQLCGIDYDIIESQPDGVGLTVLILQKF